MRIHWPHLAIALLALAATTAPAGAQENESLAVRIFDVSALQSVERDAEFEPFGLSPPSWIGIEGTDETEPTAPLEIDMLLELIRTQIDVDGWDAEGRIISSSDGGRLFVRQTPAVLDRIAAYLSWLDSALRRRVEVGVHWVTFAGPSVERLRASGLLAAAERGSLDDREVAGLLTEADLPGNEHESGTASSANGSRVAIRRATFVSYLQDYDVEIAQAAQVGDPIVAIDREGFEAYVRPRPLLDGTSVGLEVLARAGRFRKPMPVVQTEATELGTIDLPVFSTVNLGLSGVVRPGRSMATVVRSPAGRVSVLLVTPTVKRSDAKKPKDVADVLDCRFVSARIPRILIGWSAEAEERRGVAPRVFHTYAEESRIDVDTLIETLRESIDPDSWEQEGVFIMGGADDVIWLRHSADHVALARLQAAREEARLARTVRVDARVFSVPASSLREAGAVLAPGSRPDAGVLARLAKTDGARELRGVTLDALVGRWACAQSGVSRNFILDYDVEVAQEARISDPIIGQIFDGLLLNVRPVLSLDGEEVTLRIGMRLARVEEGSADTPRRTGSAMNGVLHHPRERTVRYNGTVAFPLGGCRIIDGGADDDGRRLVIVLGAR